MSNSFETYIFILKAVGCRREEVSTEGIQRLSLMFNLSNHPLSAVEKLENNNVLGKIRKCKTNQ